MVGTALFNFFLSEGLREHHRFLDIGCGSLRVGRLLIPFLMPGRYHGVEPAEEQVSEGLREEVVKPFGQGLVEQKKPSFDYNDSFNFSAFDGSFDYILAFAVFIHCGRGQLKSCLNSVRQVMHPASVFFLDLLIDSTSREEGRHRKYKTASHQVTAYSMDDAEDVIRSSHFSHEVVDLNPHPSGIDSRTIFALRLAANDNDDVPPAPSSTDHR